MDKYSNLNIKTLLFLLAISCCANAYSQSNARFICNRPLIREKSPSIDTIRFKNKESDTIAIFQTEDIICYTNGAVFLEDLIYNIKEYKSLLDSTEINENKCLETYELNLKLTLNQLTSHKDTIYLNQLKLKPNIFCGLHDDKIALNLKYFTFKVYNIKTKKYEPFLINKRVHKNRKIWYDQYKTIDGINIYKASGTLDKY